MTVKAIWHSQKAAFLKDVAQRGQIYGLGKTGIWAILLPKEKGKRAGCI
jgi:hypothetical protein